MEHVIHVVVLVLPVEENLLLTVLLQIVADGHQEAGGAAGGITNDLVSLGLHQIHHHTDDMTGCAELAVDACGGDLGEQILVHIAPGVGGFELRHLLIDAIHGCDDLVQHQGCRHLEDGIAHVFGIGAFFITMQILDERKDPFLYGAVHLCCRKIVEYAPFELASVHSTVSGLYFFGKDALIGQAKHSCLFGAEIIGVVQVMDKHQISHLFNDVQRICQAAGPEDFPKAVDFTSQFTCYHIFTPSPSSMCRRYSVLR